MSEKERDYLLLSAAPASWNAEPIYDLCALSEAGGEKAMFL